SAFAPDRMLLAGLALGAFFDSIAVALMASGDPRAAALLYWMSGSTYRVHGTEAGTALAIMAIGLALAPLCARWLEILPLGESTSRALGVDLGRARLCLMLLTALLAAAATLVV
ncbi:iron chelate uptake ABC transporter family permease subunit, partial [Klebsiella pneumoniae]|uniref:iron chelate uptake ABC transporter family permease subunit n=1 Tax=Klebsiella pneumoniae TaxID=573 RepID=UPI003EE3ABB3